MTRPVPPLRTCTVTEVRGVGGAVVVVDVLRAFSTASVALAHGPSSYELVGAVRTAFARRAADPSTVLVGEVDAHTVPGFDLGNSPVDMAAAGAIISGRPVVHRSSAGTQGVVGADRAGLVLAASFRNAGATARQIAGNDDVTFCITGVHGELDGDEDLAAAELVWALAHGEEQDPGPYLARVPRSTAGRRFLSAEEPDLHSHDVDAAMQIDAEDVALRAVRGDADRWLLRGVSG